jgi:hypothetical protein
VGSLLPHLDAQDKQTRARVVCPSNVTVVETVAPISGWSVAPATTRRSFERISVYNGTPGGQEYDLAPDDQKEKGNKITQTWDVKAYRSMNVFIRCRYHDTSAVLLRELSSDVTSCTLQFTAAANGAISADSTVECR